MLQKYSNVSQRFLQSVHVILRILANMHTRILNIVIEQHDKAFDNLLIIWIVRFPRKIIN
jgi:hypothetical protein